MSTKETDQTIDSSFAASLYSRSLLRILRATATLSFQSGTLIWPENRLDWEKIPPLKNLQIDLVSETAVFSSNAQKVTAAHSDDTLIFL